MNTVLDRAAVVVCLMAWIAGLATPVFAQSDERPQSTGGGAAGAPTAPDTGEREDASSLPAENVGPSEPASDLATQEPKPTQGIEEIVVQSQRHTQPLQDAAVSVTAFSPSDIQAMQFSDISDIAEFTPSLEIKQVFAASNPILFIRGVGLRDFNANSASAVAVVYDDVYMNSPAGQLAQLFDLEGIEVLRGPQGSLYGRNASAGAIVIRSRRPTGEPNAQVSVTYGRFDQVDVQAAFGGPVVEERLAARAALRLQRRDGYIENRCGGLTEADLPNANACGGQRAPNNPVPRGLPEEVGERKNWAGRALLRWTPGDDLDLLLNVHGGQNRGHTTQFQAIGSNPGGRDNWTYRDQDLPPRPGVPQSVLDEPEDGDPYAGDYNRVGPENLDLFGVHLTGAWTVGDATLTSISGYESNERAVFGNEDGGPNTTLQVDWTNEAWQFSQEFRADGEAGERLAWSLGAYFLVEDLKVDNFILTRPALGLTQFSGQDTLTWAVYGHGAYDLRDDLTVEAGLRYNWEHKEFALLTENVGIGSGIVIEAKNDAAESTVSAPTGDISLSWRPVDDVTLYGKYSRGFKGAHFNAGVALEREVVTPVEPESVDGFELGLKSFWLDRRLMVNVTGFLQDYRNLQVFRVRDVDGFAIVRELINANDARILGVELDVEARPVDGLRIATNGAWTQSEYKDFQTQFVNTFFPQAQNPVTRLQVQDFSGHQLINAPRLTWSGILEYDLPVGASGDGGSLIPRFEWSYRSEIFFTPLNLPEIGDGPLWKFHARLAYLTPGEHFEVALWVRNLTDVVERVDALDGRLTLSKILYVIGEPRTYGLTVSARF